MNATVDDTRIHAELDSIAAEAGDMPLLQPLGQGPAVEPPPAPMDWRMASAGLVLICDKVIAPNWQLENEEKDALASGFDQVLSAFFPTTNIDPRVQSLLALGAVMLAITAKRTDMSSGKVVPLRKAREARESKPDNAASAPDRAAA